MHRRVGLLRSPHSDTRLRDDDRTSLHDVEPIGTVARGKHRLASPKPADRMRPKPCSGDRTGAAVAVVHGGMIR